jgi:SAM-dependent methyltransferase
MKNYTSLDRCIACNSEKISLILDLGNQPLANSLKKTKSEKEDFFPLGINVCDNCFHVQLTHIVNPDLLFKNYLYVTGVSESQKKYFSWFANFATEYFRPSMLFHSPDLNVLDIGCNDGTQLDFFKKIGYKTYGVDPAKNLHKISSVNHEVVCDYFTDKCFSRCFDIVVIQNAFAHNYDQFELLKNAGKVMHDNSLLFIATSQSNMIVNHEFDTIYHEHISFYNIKSMNELCKRSNLNLIDVVKNPIHGTSYIFVISKSINRNYNIENLILLEKNIGLYDKKIYEIFSHKSKEKINQFNQSINIMKSQNIPVVGYSSPAKGNTFMNAALKGPDLIIDDTKLKQGLFTPGMTIPIYDNSKLDEYDNIDTICFVILAWNFYDEIVEKIKDRRKNKSDYFLRCFPEFNIRRG